MSSLYDPVDDSTGQAVMVGLTKASNLSDRFSRRLSLMMKSEVTLDEGVGEVVIYVAPQHSWVDEKPKAFMQELEVTLADIRKHEEGPQLEAACDDLWDSMFDFSCMDIDQTIKETKQLFQDEATQYAEFCECLFGIHDVENGSQLDIELGNEVIKLYHTVLEYNTSPKSANKLIYDTAKMVQTFESLVERLVSLLLSRFGKKLHELICELGSLKRAHGMFVRMAKDSASFDKVKVRYGRKPMKYAPILQKKANIGRAMIRPSTAPKQCKPVVTHPPRSLKGASLPFSQAGLHPQIRNAIQPYLVLEDFTSTAHLMARRSAFTLLIYLVVGHAPKPGFPGYYSFGFVACSDLQRLGGLYKVLLQAGESSAMFKQLWQALELNSLVEMFDRYEYNGFREYFPHLEEFLSTPQEQRPTVWRLVEFLHNEESTDPCAHMQRDYGFRLCKRRQDVRRLKAIYAAILKRVDPLRLHQACVDNQMLQLAIDLGVDVGADGKHLKGPSGCGYENNSGMTGMEEPLFRRK